MTDSNCTQNGCQVFSSGKCLEGFDPIDECPYLSRDPSRQSSEDAPLTSSTFVTLPSGDALTENEAGGVTRAEPTQVVILAGPVDSGKTTILVSIFESFLDAPIGNLSFAGSRTLVGFERRCHEARIASGRESPATVHTLPRAGVVFLHLKIATTVGESMVRRNLLLSDISGELFKQIRDSTRAVMELEVLRRADHLCLVVDGAKLANADQRHVARNDVRSILRSIFEAKVLSPLCIVEVVFTKWDLVTMAPDAEEIRNYATETREILKRLAAADGRDLKFHEVAARPETKLLPFAHGVPTLLRAWFDHDEVPSRARLYLPETRSDDREISRFSRSSARNYRLGDHYDVHWV